MPSFLVSVTGAFHFPRPSIVSEPVVVFAQSRSVRQSVRKCPCVVAYCLSPTSFHPRAHCYLIVGLFVTSISGFSISQLVTSPPENYASGRQAQIDFHQQLPTALVHVAVGQEHTEGCWGSSAIPCPLTHHRVTSEL
ncbi:hypothetical protein EXIGLDRAFT_406107 [Exidia glandulosa HHB12029]|uniref:Uncharacterized protein n=1 Tax=Exidia glandulosa HHB12029 TaxID=1314781 RepID=A0A165ZA52_EXIGL|nr:hypothetical protein EXIGLDRAFT_406107 [Exidia glandulosa HHB12029]